MNFFRHTISFFALLFPIIWVVLVGKKDALIENVLLGLGGCISSLFFYLWGFWDNNKAKTLILQRIKERSNGETILISHQERTHLGALMKGFVKQSGKIANATGNMECLSPYKATEKMKHKLKTI